MNYQIIEDPDFIKLQFNKEWIDVGIITIKNFVSIKKEYMKGEDHRTEHYRWGAFRAFLKTNDFIPPEKFDRLYNLGKNDSDYLMGRAMIFEIIKRLDCPQELINTAIDDSDITLARWALKCKSTRNKNKIMNINFDEAENLFKKGSYEEAFIAFAKIAENSEYDLLLRSDAYNMMGAIISGPCPYLSDSDDESGLTYFRKSIQINPKNLGAVLNIIETYASSPTGHQDENITRVACKSLQNNFWHKLSKHEKELLERTYQKLASVHCNRPSH